MLTVPEAAKRVGKDPETLRRWIRAGKIASRKIGTQYFLDEMDVDALVSPARTPTLPEEWRFTAEGSPQPDWVRLVRRSRQAH
jgi:excisionase family DNA binding protein